jgi:hypothetical protein
VWVPVVCRLWDVELQGKEHLKFHSLGSTDFCAVAGGGL